MESNAKRIRNLPPQTTPFIGRSEELSEILERLVDPACRLLTLVGPGGIGKTRLAIQAAIDLPVELKNGVALIFLQPVQLAKNLVHAITDGLSLLITDQNNPEDQLIDYLSNRDALIVLDNFEHLLSDTSVELVLHIIQNAPKVKLLLTSREVLNLQEEWVYMVHGLPIPSGQNLGDLEASSAAKLFIVRARQVRQDFSHKEETASITRICQLTGGMPLALELAASWTRILTCTTIADEIEKNIDFLTTRMRNIPDRHRSIQAVFDHSWERLSRYEKEAFKKLSIFRGGFQKEVAAVVTGATLPVLTGLVDKSLLNFDSTGRYQIHEILRQIGEEKLCQNPTDAEQVQDSFCRYYLDYVNQRTKTLMADRQQETSIAIETELENIRTAWKWILERDPADGLGQFVMTLSLFFQYRSRYLEGLAMLEKAAQILDQQTPSLQRDLSLASVQCDISWLLIRLGQLEKAEGSAQASYTLVRKHQAPPSEAQGLHPLLPLGIIASIRGDYAESIRLAEIVRLESEVQSHPWNRQFSYYLLTRAALLQGDIESAQRYAHQTYSIAQSNNDDWFLAYCLAELGNVACEIGDRDTARQRYQASYDLRRDFEDPEGMAAALTNLGFIDLMDKDYQRASEHFRSAEMIYSDINDKGGLATSLHGIARIAVAQTDFHTARQYYNQALQICADIQYYSQGTSILADIGQILLDSGETAMGDEILGLIVNHPASEPATRERIRRLLPTDKPTPQLGEDDLDELVSRLLANFPELGKSINPLRTASSSITQPLIDPLTERELEVLQNIAQGLTNQQIAALLFISPGTAKWYASQIYRKLGVKNRTQAVARARELNLINR